MGSLPWPFCNYGNIAHIGTYLRISRAREKFSAQQNFFSALHENPHAPNRTTCGAAPSPWPPRPCNHIPVQGRGRTSGPEFLLSARLFTCRSPRPRASSARRRDHDHAHYSVSHARRSSCRRCSETGSRRRPCTYSSSWFRPMHGPGIGTLPLCRDRSARMEPWLDRVAAAAWGMALPAAAELGMALTAAIRATAESRPVPASEPVPGPAVRKEFRRARMFGRELPARKSSPMSAQLLRPVSASGYSSWCPPQLLVLEHF